MTVRTRFAPSPTGYLHIGGARTALFAWLYARRHGGTFILRVEDTDRERSTDASVEAILEGMEWLGLTWDEGPYYQTKRFHRYQRAAERMLDSGAAYHCYCTPERLAEVRERRKVQGLTGYDGHCRNLMKPPADAPPPVLRFRNPEAGAVAFHDLVKGDIVKENQVLNDFVMMRADGTPTYNFAVVIDDLEMRISHVIRGDDHLDNTASQINLYRALDAELPAFAHVPMILGHDGERLSKRHGAVSVLQYRTDGYLPSALLNYLVRLGWSHGDQEIFSREELVTLFDLEDVNRAASRFNPEKLSWLNQHYLQHGDDGEVKGELAWHLRERRLDPATGPDAATLRALFSERATTVEDMLDQATFLYRDFKDFEPKAAKKALRPAAAEPLAALRDALGAQEDWAPEALQAVIQGVVDALGVGFGKVGQPLRLALTGRGAAPSNDAVLAALGKDRSLARIDRALAYIEARSAEAG